MIERTSSTELQKPSYRVRLFISVDIVNSTGYKSERSQSEWRKEFVSFFTQFPRKLRSNLSEKNCCNYCHNAKANYEPKIWRTRGDELIFVVTLNSVHHLLFCMEAFRRTIADYSQASSELKLKGNAWTAAFPAPNVTVFTHNANITFQKEVESNRGSLDSSLSNEEQEKIADEHPAYFDFLGEDMDAGFRIARNSRPDFVTISPGLAYLVCQSAMYENETFKSLISALSIERLEVFKGVAKGREYPVLGFLGGSPETAGTIEGLNQVLIQPRGTARDLKEGLQRLLYDYGFEAPVLSDHCEGETTVTSKAYSDFLQDWKKIQASDSDQGKHIPSDGIPPAVADQSEPKPLTWLKKN